MDEKIKQEEQEEEKEEQERQQDKQKNKEFYRNLFYQKWGTYENYLNKCGKEINNEKRERKRELNKERRRKKRNLYLKVKGDNDNELWISPEGTRKEFFFTCKKTTMKAIKNFKWEDDKINKQKISLF